MDALIKYGGLQKNPLYSCQENHPIGERREIIGVASILMGIVASFFFIYCLKIMLNPDLFKLSCYKIMFFVGVVDVLAIFISAILTGVLGYIGATFCDYPFLIYISGALGLSFWCCSCLANIVLLINRILCFKSIKYYEMFFDGFRTYVALILPIIYGLYFLIFTKPVIFSPTIFAWIFDPQIYSNRSSEYRNIYHTMNNFVMVVITSVLYIWILVIVLQNWIQRKKSADDNHSRLTSKTMEALIKYGGLQSNPLYDCSKDTTVGIRREIIGLISMIIGTVTSILFIICLKIMLCSDLIKLSCYKIMFFVGVLDVLAICVNAILTGFLGFYGITFCEYPLLIYLSGAAGLTLWCSSCLANIVLLVNRILCFKSLVYYEMFFEGYRVYITLLLPIIYGLYFLIFTKPVIFSSALFAWLFDPLIFPDRSLEYANVYHYANNFVVVVITLVLYIYIIIIAIQNCRKPTDETTDAQSQLTAKKNNTVLKQAVAICAIDQLASIFYVAMNFVTFPAWSGILAQFLWFCAHAFPVVIYLTMNRTMKSRFLRMFCKAKYAVRIGQSTTVTK
ncbi:unnamed protein product [Caenorhabditis angaria]|uniref:Uncharacterized protein n=1 Tax=Caenorhabditis angaria TaxID=860376 RepID=A0A9P1IV82_9PELO|nr:unnamed protein product [Caenorhabditis angaria]